MAFLFESEAKALGYTIHSHGMIGNDEFARYSKRIGENWLTLTVTKTTTGELIGKLWTNIGVVDIVIDHFSLPHRLFTTLEGYLINILNKGW